MKASHIVCLIFYAARTSTAGSLCAREGDCDPAPYPTLGPAAKLFKVFANGSVTNDDDEGQVTQIFGGSVGGVEVSGLGPTDALFPVYRIQEPWGAYTGHLWSPLAEFTKAQNAMSVLGDLSTSQELTGLNEGLVLEPGVYKIGGDNGATLSDTLKLVGNGKAGSENTWIFILNSLTVASTAKVEITDGVACNVWWSVGAQGVYFDGEVEFLGNLISSGDIDLRLGGKGSVHTGLIASTKPFGLVGLNKIRVLEPECPVPTSTPTIQTITTTSTTTLQTFTAKVTKSHTTTKRFTVAADYYYVRTLTRTRHTTVTDHISAVGTGLAAPQGA